MKDFLDKIYEACKKDYLKVSLAFLAFFFLFSLMYLSINRFTSLDDHFFHIRFAEIVKNEGLDVFSNFHWLYFSKISLNQTYFVYYNFLFYLVLIPFTFITPLFLGIKLYAVIFASISFTGLYLFFLKIKEKNAFLWVIILLAIINYGSIWRFFLTRPYAFAPVLLILELYLLYRKKYIGIFILSFIYLYWHSVTFFFPLGVAVIYFMFDAFYNDNKPDWKIIVYSFSGMALAILIMNFFAPGLFFYIKNIVFGIFRDTVIGEKINIAEGSELYPADFIDFIKNNALIVSLLMIAVVFEIYRYIQERKNDIAEESEEEKKKRPLKGTLFFLTVGFLLGIFLSKRNGDFFVFFSAAYIVISFNYFLKYIEIRNILIKKALFTGIIITTVYLFSANLLFLHEQIASTGPHDAIEGTADWLKNNTKKGDIIFNASWNWFTVLFYYNTHNNYIVGIEPRFLYDYNPEMYWAWWNISNNGYVCFEEQCDNLMAEKKFALKKDERKKDWYEKQGSQSADVINNLFKSNYVVTSKGLTDLNDLMDNSSHFRKVYTDSIYDSFFIYEVVR